jgi:hypothetical protein
MNDQRDPASAARSVATLRATLSAIDAQLTAGSLAADGLADLKSAIDDVRLRLWGALMTNDPQDYNGFRQRFRLRRATEICRGVATDLAQGALPRTHDELPGLGAAAHELATRITRAPEGHHPTA